MKGFIRAFPFEKQMPAAAERQADESNETETNCVFGNQKQ